MPKISNRTIDEKIKALVFGPSKVGKTFGAGTFPRANFLDFDRGTATLTGRDFLTRFGKQHHEIMYEEFYDDKRSSAGVVTTPSAFDDAHKYFHECMKPTGNWKGVPVSVSMFDTWVVDTGTTLSEAAMNKGMFLLNHSSSGGKLKGAKSETHEEALRTGAIVPKLQDYGAERSMVEQFINMVVQTDKHVLFLCHTKELTTPTGEVTQVVPLLTGKGVEACCAMFDEVWFLQARKLGKELVRELVTQTNGIIKCGSRLGIPSGTPFEFDIIQKVRQEILKETNQHKEK